MMTYGKTSTAWYSLFCYTVQINTNQIYFEDISCLLRVHIFIIFTSRKQRPIHIRCVYIRKFNRGISVDINRYNLSDNLTNTKVWRCRDQSNSLWLWSYCYFLNTDTSCSLHGSWFDRVTPRRTRYLILT